MPTPDTHSKYTKYFNRFSVIIITGGSSGIGCSIIKAILKLQPDAHLCNLSRTKPEIFLGTHGQHFPVDLCDSKALAEVAEALSPLVDAAPHGEVLLINNSGFGDYGRLSELEISKQLSMIDLNVRAVVDLTARMLPHMLPRGGVVVNIASTAAFQPTPYMATYGASKTFVRNWSLALNDDLRGTRVRSLAICPGPTRSNFFKSAGFASPPMNQGAGGSLDMTADEVAAYTIRAIVKGKTLLVTGWKNRCIAFFGGKSPLVAVTRIGGIILRKMRLEQHRK